MIKFPHCPLFLRVVVLSVALLTGCGGSERPPETVAAISAPKTPPGVVEVVRHYAGLMTRSARMASPASRRFADSAAVLAPDSGSFYLELPACFVEAWLNDHRRLTTVFIKDNAPLPVPAKPLDFSIPPVGRLVRLGELRRAFGPGKLGDPSITKEIGTRRYPVVFDYQSAPNGRPVHISADMSVPSYADTAMVYVISIHSNE